MNMQSPQNAESPEEMPPHLELQEVETEIRQIEEELRTNDTYYKDLNADYEAEYQRHKHEYGDAVFPPNVQATLYRKSIATRDHAMAVRPELKGLYRKADNLRQKINQSKPSSA
ncbi:MAG: hypothetical protein GWP15_04215 [Nitrospirae bacterium]|nr:hypothetical protein [Nitrospirota bacterium]